MTPNVHGAITRGVATLLIGNFIAPETSFATLNQALKRLARNKKELLLVLERPDIPLHNNI